MLALYRSGRQAEALAAYRDARSVYVEELGIEPTRRLQELEQRILRQDPSLDAPAPARPQAGCDSSGRRAQAGDRPRRGARRLSRGQRSRAFERPARALPRQRHRRDRGCGGRVETFAGDTLTVAFGAPVAQEDHTPRALHAALSLQRRIADDFGGALQLRVGIDAGELLSGGRSGLAGAAVVEAARLQQAARAGDDPRRRAGRRDRPPRLRVRPAELRRARRVPGRPLLRALTVTESRGLRRFVGRTAELESLRAAFRRVVADGEPRLVTVAGDAGVGKTRLVRELWEELAATSPEPLRRTGRCIAYGPGTTYRPIADVLREQLGLLETDAPETVSRRLGRHEILGLMLGHEADADLHPLAAREALHAGCVAFLAELVSAQPAVVLVEDLHWAQEPLLDLLERALDEVAGPLLLVCTARPELLEQHPAWGRRRNAETVWLEPLPDADARVLLDDLCPPEVPREVRSLLVERAEGNPFFLEELPLEPGRAARPAGCSTDSRQRARRPRGPHRPASGDREGRAAGGGGDRPRLLARAGARAARRGDAGLRPARGARFRAATAGLGACGRARAHVPARADPRGRVRGSSRSRAARASTLPSPSGWSASATAAESTPRCSPTTTPRRRGPRTPTSPGPTTTPSWSGFARRPSPGSAGRPSSRSAGTSSTRRSPCCTVRSS